ncbi:hypothetical protein CYFUS_001095 [Cystobacter fuscus]|uniref:Uncharacterized protein n=1 Tax=Cystobacter fuscus TaxID=43 RepID=A0A250IWY7_9BACT|nr:hypothetical protein [Cystobacter fuscus]ATB35681.1 hypothetical protein CYFUS_001095 [Cystobacter fuscus]
MPGRVRSPPAAPPPVATSASKPTTSPTPTAAANPTAGTTTPAGAKPADGFTAGKTSRMDKANNAMGLANNTVGLAQGGVSLAQSLSPSGGAGGAGASGGAGGAAQPGTVPGGFQQALAMAQQPMAAFQQLLGGLTGGQGGPAAAHQAATSALAGVNQLATSVLGGINKAAASGGISGAGATQMASTLMGGVGQIASTLMGGAQKLLGGLGGSHQAPGFGHGSPVGHASTQAAGQSSPAAMAGSASSAMAAGQGVLSGAAGMADMLKGGTGALAKAAGRFAPGLNIAVAGMDVANAAKTFKDPNATMGQKVTAGITAGGSVLAATNIPVVSQVGAAVSTVASLAGPAIEGLSGAAKSVTQGFKQLLGG